MNTSQEMITAGGYCFNTRGILNENPEGNILYIYGWEEGVIFPSYCVTLDLD
jgi:hypothetical protein